MTKRFGIVLVWVLGAGGRLLADDSTTVRIGKDFKSVELNRQVSYFLDSTLRSTWQEIRGKSNAFSPLNGPYINFKDAKATCWLKVTISNTSNELQPLALVTSGLDSVFFYAFKDDSLVQTSMQGTHIRPAARGYVGPLQLFQFQLPVAQTRTILVKARMINYPLSVYPFTLSTTSEAFSQWQKETLFRSFCVGGMVIILLFAAYMALFFRGRLYLYYLLCVCCSLVMLLIFNEYHFVLFDTSPDFIRNKNAFGFLVVLVPACYLLFAKEFVSYGFVAPANLTKLTYVSLGYSLLVLLFVVPQDTFYQAWARSLAYVSIVTNTALSLYYVFKSIKNGYQPGWLFVVATGPILLLSAWESLSHLHQTPIQKMHSLYYTFTLFEMYMLMLGLAGRFKVYQEGRKQLQQEMFEVQIKTEEKIRQRIGADLHDKVGGLLTALKINLDVLRIKQADTTPDPYQKVFEIIDIAAGETRRISHEMMSNQFQERGLVAILKELYQDMESPVFAIQTTGLEQRLNPTLEMALFSIINESITNVLKHAEASRVDIQINRNKHDELALIIEDDGKGFDSQESSSSGRGLTNLTARVKEHLRGDFIIDSSAGKGTIVMVKLKIKE